MKRLSQKSQVKIFRCLTQLHLFKKMKELLIKTSLTYEAKANMKCLIKLNQITVPVNLE